MSVTLSGCSYHGLTVRGDWYACPLAVGIDTYYGCEFNCSYCAFLALNHTWGRGQFRGLDLKWLAAQIRSARHGRRHLSQIGFALRDHKTMRLGNKYDPFQPVEEREKITARAIDMLTVAGYQLKVETKNPTAALRHMEELRRTNSIVTTTILVGLEDDWATLEGSRPPAPLDRLVALKFFAEAGFQVAISTEAYIPGYHTPAKFREAIRLFKSFGVRRINVYNLRLNPFVLKRLAALGLDVVAIFDANQDEPWKRTLTELLEIGEQEEMTVGCPDWVNMGARRQGANTCCGVDAANPTTFNQVTWRELAMDAEGGQILDRHVEETFDGIGDLKHGLLTFKGFTPGFYSLADTGLFERTLGGWRRRDG